MLHSNQADLSVGGIRQTVERSTLGTSTHNYLQTSVRFGVLGTSYELTSLDIIFFPFRTSLWLGIGVVFALSLLIHLTMNRLLALRHQGCLVLNVLLVFVGMPMAVFPRSIAKRVHCIMLILYTLLIRTMYQGMLYHLIRTRMLNRLPQSLEEVVAHNYEVVLSSGISDVLSEIPVMQQMLFHVVDGDGSLMYPLHYLVQNPRGQRQVGAATLETFLLFNQLSAKTQTQQQEINQFEIMSQDVIYMQMTMYLRKHSFLIDAFNEEIMWMRSGGLLAVWERWELDEIYLRDVHSTTHRIFGLHELYIIFVLMLIGLMFSTLLFCLELISLRFPRFQRWLLAE
ncbi:hypothetical protein AWZ03_012884 [Drosophila navojoa]|uniref:Ionotropic glutamate receptor C-terminal domain-containing protein n=1 Tax=Drosophila navojoa TaxID=7232 RepID=A0A484AVL9_DRONA|nr:uncharacterized protein LOC108655579 [Drosophila navojoa]TDG40697.1 hypothetical protein AWZ03_012884 [Drosophila navojoa]